mmetsp:Transcript_59513/g.166207  ORF Transcript_59513/g.166207 Transcript_59513/m.166207 type:complete len:228 (+) Transcript_59513:1312-1995(+)
MEKHLSLPPGELHAEVLEAIEKLLLLHPSRAVDVERPEGCGGVPEAGVDELVEAGEYLGALKVELVDCDAPAVISVKRFPNGPDVFAPTDFRARLEELMLLQRRQAIRRQEVPPGADVAARPAFQELFEFEHRCLGAFGVPSGNLRRGLHRGVPPCLLLPPQPPQLDGKPLQVFPDHKLLAVSVQGREEQLFMAAMPAIHNDAFGELLLSEAVVIRPGVHSATANFV